MKNGSGDVHSPVSLLPRGLSLWTTVALLAMLSITGCATRGASAPDTVIVMVRHAEKAAEPADDPPLTPAGLGRAEALAHALASSAPAAIYTTRFRRSVATAQPLAKRLGIETTVDDSPAFDLGKNLLARHRGRKVILIGHSNTIPDILRSLGVKDPPPIAHDQYDDLFICTVRAGRETELLWLKYGEGMGK